jgi:hypothetical protein
MAITHGVRERNRILAPVIAGTEASSAVVTDDIRIVIVFRGDSRGSAKRENKPRQRTWRK